MFKDPAIDLDQALTKAIQAAQGSFNSGDVKKTRILTRIQRQEVFRKAELAFLAYYLASPLASKAEDLVKRARFVFDRVESINPSKPYAEEEFEEVSGEYRNLIELGLMVFQKHFDLNPISEKSPGPGDPKPPFKPLEKSASLPESDPNPCPANQALPLSSDQGVPNLGVVKKDENGSFWVLPSGKKIPVEHGLVETVKVMLSLNPKPIRREANARQYPGRVGAKNIVRKLKHLIKMAESESGFVFPADRYPGQRGNEIHFSGIRRRATN